MQPFVTIKTSKTAQHLLHNVQWNTLWHFFSLITFLAKVHTRLLKIKSNCFNWTADMKTANLIQIHYIHVRTACILKILNILHWTILFILKINHLFLDTNTEYIFEAITSDKIFSLFWWVIFEAWKKVLFLGFLWCSIWDGFARL